MTKIISREEYRKLTSGDGRTDIHPEHWPDDVNIISIDGISVLGLDCKGNIYLDGHQLYTKRRLDTQERIIAWIVALSAFVGALAAVISAISDWTAR